MNNHNPSDQTKARIEAKITYLQDELEQLKDYYYVPETYHLLIQELDYQTSLLKRIQIKNSFSKIDSNL